MFVLTKLAQMNLTGTDDHSTVLAENTVKQPKITASDIHFKTSIIPPSIVNKLKPHSWRHNINKQHHKISKRSSLDDHRWSRATPDEVLLICVSVLFHLRHVLLFHLRAPHLRVRGRSEQHNKVADPPEQRLDVVIIRRRDHRLRARLRRPGYIMGQRRRHLNLKPGDVSDRKAQGASDDHVEPERDVGEMRERHDYRYITGQEHERHKKDQSVEVVVESQAPYVLVDGRKRSLDQDRVHRHAEAGAHAEDDPAYRQRTWRTKSQFVLSCKFTDLWVARNVTQFDADPFTVAAKWKTHSNGKMITLE